jgi:hypothetical protein
MSPLLPPAGQRSSRFRRGLVYVLIASAIAVAIGAAVMLGRQFGLTPDGAGSPSDAWRAAELQLAAQRANMCSAANATGVGLRGEYFAGEGMRGAVLLSRVDAVLAFDPLTASPGAASSPAPRSVRWTGWIKPPISGNYRFHVHPSVGRIVVANQPLAGDSASADAVIELAAGRYYPIQIELDQLIGLTNRIQVEWTLPYGARLPIARAHLFLPTATAAPHSS